ncbi:MAG: DinB family protein [Acidobacteria bacterium]|nr:DinB family protein [Acidobacteriota bacterium]
MQIPLILRSLDQAYDRTSWHGTNLRGSLRGVDAPTAAWRPGPKRHNIAELAVHAAYWKYSVLRRMEDLPRGSFPLEGGNWFARGPELSAQDWKADLKLLGEMHRKLRTAVAALDDTALAIIPAGSKTTMLDLLLGVAAHDLYHAGQIQIIKRLHS